MKKLEIESGLLSLTTSARSVSRETGNSALKPRRGNIKEPRGRHEIQCNMQRAIGVSQMSHPRPRRRGRVLRSEGKETGVLRKPCGRGMGLFKVYRTVGRPERQYKAGREDAKPPGTQVRGENGRVQANAAVGTFAAAMLPGVHASR
ncbi:hypothetical protein NDU88_001034 [Pleurodeles waltl]|uniref:Uncharacterized protein n=1 Tax=Pleurodeles waltl TaxID=8319 RepID=A0AAV7SY84_PLEWA|nr:hypothetical protein NDU88_001034 [Pleurodeles waltl]